MNNVPADRLEIDNLKIFLFWGAGKYKTRSTIKFQSALVLIEAQSLLLK